jgi:cardiolipin synthase (CMP-forming)
LGQLPNLLSILRFFAAPLLVYLIVRHKFGTALLICIPVGISDWADGYLARRWGSLSRLGAYLDPSADKLLLVSSFISLAWIREIPYWLAALVIGRDFVIVVGVFLLWKLRGHREFTPLLIGKFSTAFQILTILIVLIVNVWPNPLLVRVRTGCFVLTGLFTTLSWLGYVRKGIRMASVRSSSADTTRNYL